MAGWFGPQGQQIQQPIQQPVQIQYQGQPQQVPMQPTQEFIDKFRVDMIEWASENESSPNLPNRYFRFRYKYEPESLSDYVFVTKTALGALVLFLEKMEGDGITDGDLSSYRKVHQHIIFKDKAGLESLVQRMQLGNEDLEIHEQSAYYFNLGTSTKSARMM